MESWPQKLKNGMKQEAFRSDLCPTDEFEGGKPNTRTTLFLLKVLGERSGIKLKGCPSLLVGQGQVHLLLATKNYLIFAR